MPQTTVDDNNRLSNLQLEFLKSLKYMATEEQVSDIRSLLRHYFAHQLNASIEKTEKERGYSAAIYETWLKEKNPTE